MVKGQQLGVRVISISCKRLMPCSPRKARQLIKSQKAVAICNNPFTIRLKHGSSGFMQRKKMVRESNKKICKLSTSQIFKIARKYLRMSSKRQLVRKVYRLARNDGIEYMASLMNVPTEQIAKIGAIELYKKTRLYAKRGRKFQPQQANLEIKMLANELAGGGAVNITGGKRTTHKAGTGSLRSASSEQAWQAKCGN